MCHNNKNIKLGYQTRKHKWRTSPPFARTLSALVVKTATAVALCASLNAITANAITANAVQTHTQCVQFRAEDYISGVWSPVNATSETMSSANVPASTNGWIHAVKNVANRVSFTDTSAGVPTPLGFDASASNLVKSVFMVLVCEESSRLGTVISAPCPARFVSHPNETTFNPPSPSAARKLTDSFRDKNNVVRVGSQRSGDTTILKPGPIPQLVEVEFLDDDTALSDVFVGGAAANSAWLWKRNFKGSFLEIVVVCDTALTPREANCVRRYLSNRYGLKLKTESDENITQILKSLGVNHDGAFTSIILVR